MRPPCGAAIAVVTPLARAIGIISESGWIATDALTWLLISSISDVSFVAEIDPISVKPIDVPALIMPGVTVMPVASMIVASSGTRTFSPTAVIRPPCTTIVPRSIGAPVIVRIRPPTIAIGVGSSVSTGFATSP